MHHLLFSASCSWSTPTSQNNVLKCNDGTYCNGLVDGWTCCNTRGMRAKCPLNYPAMCAKPDCAWGDYCCYTQDVCLASKGGLRSCDDPSKSLVQSRYIFTLLYSFVYFIVFLKRCICNIIF